MNSEQFSRFLKDLNDVFSMKINPRQSEVWLTVFKDIDFDVAEKMINLYYANPNQVRGEREKPKPHNLLEMKNMAIQMLAREGREVKKIKDCKACNNTGMIVVKKFIKGYSCLHDYICYCACEHGNKSGTLDRISRESVQSNENKSARYMMIKKNPLVLLDTQIHKYNQSMCDHTYEHLTSDEIKELLDVDRGRTKNTEDAEKQKQVIRNLFSGGYVNA